MSGRLEHRIKKEKNIRKILSDLPPYVSDFYYNISVSSQPSTCEDYLRKIRRFLYFIDSKDVKNIDIANITENDISKYFKSLEQFEVNGQLKIVEVSDAYKQSIWSALKRFFDYFYKQKRISFNPVTVIDRPNNNDEIERVLLTEEDFGDILSCVKNGYGDGRGNEQRREWQHRDLLIFQLFMSTGMRKTALTEIDLDDISIEDRTLVVTDKRKKTHEYFINDVLIESLNQWLIKRANLIENSNKEDVNHNALFISNRMQRISPEGVSKIVKKYTKESIGSKLSPHKFRAGFCSILYEKTKDIEFVRDAVGQADISTTQRYILKKDDAKLVSSNLMNNVISM